MHITTSYELTFDDLYRSWMRAHGGRGRIWWVTWFAAVTGGGALVGAVVGGQPWWCLYAVPALGAAAYGMYQLAVKARLTVRRSMPRFAGITEVTITAESVRVCRPTGTTEAVWSVQHKIENAPDYLFLHQNDRTTMVLKRHMTADQQAELADFIAALGPRPAR